LTKEKQSGFVFFFKINREKNAPYIMPLIKYVAPFELIIDVLKSYESDCNIRFKKKSSSIIIISKEILIIFFLGPNYSTATTTTTRNNYLLTGC
jgi:hypothetical protein